MVDPDSDDNKAREKYVLLFSDGQPTVGQEPCVAGFVSNAGIQQLKDASNRICRIFFLSHFFLYIVGEWRNRDYFVRVAK